MLNRTLLALAFLALPVAAAAQPAVPAVPPAPGARPAPVAVTPAAPVRPAAPARVGADDPPTSDVARATAPAFAPAAVVSAPAAPRPAPPASASDAPPTSGAPIATASAAPATDLAPTTDAAAATPAIPLAESLQTVTKNYTLTAEGNARFLATFATLPGVKTLDGGVMYRPLVVGKGTNSPLGRLDLVTVSYRGWMIDGTSFDNSPPGSPRNFQIAQLIEGWRTALLKMKVGDLWEIAIPAPLAYGPEGRPGRIPPNQTLVFVVSLAKVEYAG